LWSFCGLRRLWFDHIPRWSVAFVRHLRRRHPGSETLMLNIGRLGADGADYYLSQVVSGVEDYYTGSGEAPGYWLGSESEALGLVGLVDADRLAAVLDGCDPVSGESLGKQRGRKVPGVRSDVPGAEERQRPVGSRAAGGQ
jgi:hypothetical protein